MAELNLNHIGHDLQVELSKIAAEEGLSVEEVVEAIIRDAIKAKQQPHIATRLIERFSKVGLRDDETIDELKGQEVRSPDLAE
ncbi:hypothetical protein N9L06_04780 [Mariniblastus sp.]|nr:hypothetical protein [Mariniblastus sp.]